MVSAAKDDVKFQRHFQKIVNFFQNIFSKKETYYFAKIDMNCIAISHVIARGISSNTRKQEKDDG